MSDKFRSVSQEEFKSFLASYAGKLEHDCVSIADPPIHNYCDWSKATSPIGTGDAHDEACQAYCVYADERGGTDKFYIRVEAAA